MNTEKNVGILTEYITTMVRHTKTNATVPGESKKKTQNKTKTKTKQK